MWSPRELSLQHSWVQLVGPPGGFPEQWGHQDCSPWSPCSDCTAPELPAAQRLVEV